MTYDVELMLRGDARVHTESLSYPRDASSWAEEDAAAVLKQVLAVVDKFVNPGAESGRPVALRGMNWIVSPYKDAVVIAFEIHSASVVAGPFRIEREALDRLIHRAMSAERGGASVH